MNFLLEFQIKYVSIVWFKFLGCDELNNHKEIES